MPGLLDVPIGDLAAELQAGLHVTRVVRSGGDPSLCHVLRALFEARLRILRIQVSDEARRDSGDRGVLGGVGRLGRALAGLDVGRGTLVFVLPAAARTASWIAALT